MLNIDNLKNRGNNLSLDLQVQNIIRRQSLANNGVWYDPSDLSTLFQDAAGTIPVTAVEQPVGKILDKSGRGNHATQSTAGYKPILSARYNSIINSEDLTASNWVKSRVTVTPNVSVAPDGSISADLVTNNVGTSDSISTPFTPPVASRYGARFWIKGYGTTNTLGFSIIQSSAHQATTARVISGPGAISGATLKTISGLSVNEWTLIEITTDAALAVSAAQLSFYCGNVGSLGAQGVIWGADVRPLSDWGIAKYQRVNTASDYDTIGFPKYLAFDGLDDFLVTGNVDFSSSDKIAVAAGVRKLSDATAGIIAETSNAASANNGAFGIYGPNSAATATYGCVVRGTVATSTNSIGFASPNSAIVTFIDSIGSDDLRLRANGVQIGASFADQGSGNFGNYPLYIGRRGGTSLPFNGRLYGLAICGGMDDIYKLKKIERYLAQKTGVII